MNKLLSVITCISMAVGMIMPIHGYAQDNESIVLYVAVDGNDNNSGSISEPLASMEAARDKLRELKNNGKSVDGATVIFREGDYSISSAVEFTNEDSGSSDAPIKYRAFYGETVQFMGTVKIKSDSFSKLTDTAMIDRCASSEAAKNIIQYNLSDMGINNISEPNWPGAYSYSWAAQQIHGITKGEGAPEVFVNGKAMTLARFPNDTTMKIAKVINGGEVIRNWYDDKKGTDGYIELEDRKPTPFTVVPSSGDVSRWEEADHALIYGKFYFSWADQTVPLGSVDAENGTITSKYPSEYGCLAGQPMYIFNLFEEIDIPGEYYIDTDTGILYLYPPEGLKNFDIYVSVLGDDMIRVNGAKNIVFDGIGVNSTKGSAYTVTNAENVVIRNAEISLTAKKAVIVEDSKACGIESCYIHDVDGGVDITGGDRETLTPAGNYVRNCHIENFARLTKTYNPGISLSGVGNEAVHNELNGAEHLAISFGGNNNLIAYNEIYDCCNASDDMGVIYSGRNPTTRGNKILFNYIHDIASNATGSLGVHGVYLDDGYCEGIIEGNVFENLTGYGVHLTGRDAVVKNNIFINIGTAIVFMDFRDASENSSLGRTLRACLTEVPWQSEVWTNAYPELADIEQYLTESNYNGNNEISGNLCVNSEKVKLHAKLSSNWGVDKNNAFVSEDPGFYDMKNRNYQLKQDAQAFELIDDFQDIPFTQMGRYIEGTDVSANDNIINDSFTSETGSWKVGEVSNDKYKAEMTVENGYLHMTTGNIGGDNGKGQAPNIYRLINDGAGLKAESGKNIVIKTRFKVTQDDTRTFLKINRPLAVSDLEAGDGSLGFYSVFVYDKGKVYITNGNGDSREPYVYGDNQIATGCTGKWIELKMVLKPNADGTVFEKADYYVNIDGTSYGPYINKTLPTADRTNAWSQWDALRSITFSTRQNTNTTDIDYVKMYEEGLDEAKLLTTTVDSDREAPVIKIKLNTNDGVENWQSIQLVDAEGSAVDADVTMLDNIITISPKTALSEGKYTVNLNNASILGEAISLDRNEVTSAKIDKKIDTQFSDGLGGWYVGASATGCSVTNLKTENGIMSFDAPETAVNGAAWFSPSVTRQINDGVGIPFEEGRAIVIRTRVKKNNAGARLYLKFNRPDKAYSDTKEMGANYYTLLAIGNNEKVAYADGIGGATEGDTSQVKIWNYMPLDTVELTGKWIDLTVVLRGNGETLRADYTVSVDNETKTVENCKIEEPSGIAYAYDFTALKNITFTTRGNADTMEIGYVSVQAFDENTVSIAKIDGDNGAADTYWADVNYRNETAYNKNVLVTLAEYEKKEDGSMTLVGVKTENTSVESGAGLSKRVGSVIKDGTRIIKAFLWEADTIKPIVPAAIVE